MLRSSTARTVLGVVLIVVVLGLLRYKPWQRSTAGGSGSAGPVASAPGAARPTLAVGFLPVT